MVSRRQQFITKKPGSATSTLGLVVTRWVGCPPVVIIKVTGVARLARDLHLSYLVAGHKYRAYRQKYTLQRVNKQNTYKYPTSGCLNVSMYTSTNYLSPKYCCPFFSSYLHTEQTDVPVVILGSNTLSSIDPGHPLTHINHAGMSARGMH
jgi:hypothetical protein